MAAAARIVIRQRRMPQGLLDFARRSELVVLLAGLHDIGKFSRVFQGLVRELWPAVLGPYEQRPGPHHDTLGMRMLRHLPAIADPLAALLPGSRSVRTTLLRAVAGHHGQTPRDVRDFVEGAYDSADKPEALAAESDRAEGRLRAASGLGVSTVLSPERDYRWRELWQPDIVTPTRLGRETVTLRRARWDGTTLRPWCDAEEAWRAWALSEVSVRRTMLERAVVPTDAGAALERVRTGWKPWAREMEVLVLQEAGGVWRGAGERRDQAGVTVVCDPREGLRFVKGGTES